MLFDIKTQLKGQGTIIKERDPLAFRHEDIQLKGQGTVRKDRDPLAFLIVRCPFSCMSYTTERATNYQKGQSSASCLTSLERQSLCQPVSWLCSQPVITRQYCGCDWLNSCRRFAWEAFNLLSSSVCTRLACLLVGSLVERRNGRNELLQQQKSQVLPVSVWI